MSFTNSLPEGTYEGTIDGIDISWRPQEITRLAHNADTLNAPLGDLKSATEHVSIACAKRLSRTKVQIWGSFHLFATVRETGLTRPDRCHCTISLFPGGLNVHIYVNLSARSGLDNMEVLGESVVLGGRRRSRGRNLSMSTGICSQGSIDDLYDDPTDDSLDDASGDPTGGSIGHD